MVPSLRSLAAILGLALLVHGCSDDPEQFHPTRATVVPSAITVGGLTYQREIVDASSPPDPWMKNIAKLDADNLPDLIVSGSQGPVVWYQAPGWTKRTIAPTASSESGSDVGDIDLDGDIDVVVGKVWYENIGGGTSWIAHALPSGSAGTHDIVVADVNSDGRPDIIMRGELASVVTVYQQVSPDAWTVFDVNPGIGLNGLDVADVNADGRADIVVGGVWMENPGGNLAASAWPAHSFAPGWNAYAAVKVIDMDGDGRNDIVLSVSESIGDLSWFQAPVDPRTGPWQANLIDTGLNKVHAFAVVDINKDGLLDVAVSEYEAPGRLIIYLRSGSNWVANELGRDALHNMRSGDIDSDGDVDLFGATAFGVNPVILYRNLAGTGTNTPPTVSVAASATPAAVTGLTTALAARGADDGGEAALSYTWAPAPGATPPGAVGFSPNGNNAASSSTATFTRAGSYTLEVTIRDAQGLSVTSSVAVNVSQTLTAVTVTPSSATVAPGGTQQFSATAQDQFGQPLSSAPPFDWSVSGGGNISATGLFTAGSSTGGPFVVMAASGGVSGTAAVSIGAAAGSARFGETAVLAQDDAGNGGLLVAQEAVLAQAGTLQTLSFYVTTASGQLRLGVYDATGPGGGPGAKRAETAEFAPQVGWNTVTVSSAVALPAGTYWLAYLSNTNALHFRMTTSGKARWYSVTYGPLPATYSSSPSSGTYHWSFYGTLVTGGGPVNQPPSVAQPAAASPAPVSGTTTALSALGADDGGAAALTYTWAATQAPAAVVFAANGSNSASNTTATFTRAGAYTFEVTIADAQGASVKSSVALTVTQTLTTITVTPGTATIAPAATQAFVATARDQFAQTLSTTPAFAWAVSGGGSISSSGVFTAGATGGGPFIVTASSGGTAGTALVTVSSTPPPPPMTIGETSILPIADGGNGNLLVAQQASLTQSRTVQSLSFYVTAASGKLRLAIYDATGPAGGPGQKRAETAELTPVAGWNTAPVVTSVVLPAGTYWLAYLSSTNALQFRMARNGNARWYARTYGPLPTAFSTAPLSGSYHWSFYATVQ